MNAQVRVEKRSLKTVTDIQSSNEQKPAADASPSRTATPKSPRSNANRKVSGTQKTKKQPKSRDSLSFTAREHREDFPDCPALINWLPVSVPLQINQWNIGVDIGLKMIDELAELASESEVEAFNAIKFAFNSPNWKVGGHGVEMGFSEGIAALAMLGLRHLALGGRPFDPEKPKPAIYWTAQRVIDKQKREVKKTSGALQALHDGRTQGMAMALLQMGLIDGEAYDKTFADLDELTKPRGARASTAQEN
ncbi:hypothetical protein A584_01806 [Pseudomonas syringae pv. theae ICMP 3923]|uniref:Uncharacterized protein n=1 Tax=Pseudomonas syringae pv. theae TaxID=103985 RepID=A0A0N8TL21_PSESX|nr:hypothetical protein [Pseudomonas syringae]EPM73245.1 hypothetical protein A584_01806 [Pseudomonas syringae pv. theae ICMP 3923]KPZ34777.1 hypothetical protein AN901_203781 [Pseudomonas syringae pv. theae]RMT65954.1 hypothetical protein ALP44_01722 [Pseudomonas syringae pv. theae]GKQ32691.1 hypothetical protein PSTH68_24250 [Pseudomonas syringae pv. theae]GKS06585.1 hypothetical protein PSTH1771_16235 [Pseudomonas syringae pv. theae]